MSAVFSPGFWAFVGLIGGIYTIFALGLHLQIGFTGIVNFGHVAFMAIGSYTMALLVVGLNWPFWLASVAAVLAAMAASALLGLATLQLRNEYMAISTIAFAEIIRYLAMNLSNLTGGVRGSTNLFNRGETTTYNHGWRAFQDSLQDWLQSIFGEVITRDLTMLVIVWSTAFALILLLQVLVKSPWGRTLKAIREDPDAAAAMGKNVLSYKLQAMAIGSALGAMAGLFFAFQFSFFAPLDFETLISFFAFIIIILGGIGRNWGVPVGAAIFGLIYAGTRFFEFWPLSMFSSTERAYLRFIIIGALLIALVLYRPQGIFGKREEMLLE